MTDSIAVRWCNCCAAILLTHVLFTCLPAQEKPGRLPSAVRKNLKSGLIAEYFQGGEHVDTQLVRIPAIQLDADESPSAFVLPEAFTVKYSGYLRLKLKSEFQIHLLGKGGVTLSLNGTKVIEKTDSTDQPFDLKATVQLVKGYNHLELEYDAPSDSARMLRAYWESDSFVREPIPPTILYTLTNKETTAHHFQLNRGRQLVFQRNCLKCHSVDQVVEPFLESRDAPSLESAGDRLNRDWMIEWILNPEAHRNDVRMPKVLDESEQSRDTAGHIASYLQSISKTRPAKNLEGNADLGGDLFENLGCVGCHRFNKPDEEDEYERISLHFADSKYVVGRLSEFLIDSRAHYRWSRMPRFKLTQKQADDLEAFIRNEAKGKVESHRKGDPEIGKSSFVTSGCANCHQAETESSTKILKRVPLFSESDGRSGCISNENSVSKSTDRNLPFFSLTKEDRLALSKFIESGKSRSLGVNPLAQFAIEQISELRCRTCHDLDHDQATLPYIIEEEGVVGLAPDRVPMLTFVGEKLLPAWSNSLISGSLKYRVREHFRLRMPEFPTRGNRIAKGLAMSHGFLGNEQPPLVVDTESAAEGAKVAAMDTGLSCNRCHAIGDRKPNAAFDAQSTNLVYAAHRLRKEYYLRWMFDPTRIDKQTKMPRFSENRKTTSLKNVHEGNAVQQFESLWHYLNQIKARKED